jgi:L-ornithine N5-oxygenase
MLLDGAEMQISFLKDLATLRNPSSPFTFLKYVHEQGRLVQFINLKQFYTTRVEFNDYFHWVADQLKQYVQYQAFVTQITSSDNSVEECLEVQYRDTVTGVEHKILAKNVVIATGGTPSLPPGINMNEPSQRVWHTSQYLSKIESFKQTPNEPYHFAVVGRGQSAAEVAYDLYKQFPNARISCLHRHFSYKPADESPFANEIFNPEQVNLFYNATSSFRDAFLEGYQDTNYSVVDIELIEKLYRTHYEDQINKRQRLSWLPFTGLTALDECDDHVAMSLKNNQNQQTYGLSVDAVILATGYQYHYPLSLLSSLMPYLMVDANQAPKVSRHYQLITSPKLKPGLYVQGCNEGTHGLTETLLSINAIRAQEILQSILNATPLESLNKEHLYAE